MTKFEYISLSLFITTLALMGTAECLDYGTARSVLYCLGAFCLICSMTVSSIAEQKINRVEKVIICLTFGSLAILVIISLIVALMSEDWALALAFILFICFFFVLPILWIAYRSPSAWLQRKLSLIKKTLFSSKTIFGKLEDTDSQEEQMMDLSPAYAAYVKRKCAQLGFIAQPEDVERVKNAEPKEIMRLFFEAKKYDGEERVGPCVTRLMELVRLNPHRKEIAILFRNGYRDNLLQPLYEYAGSASYYTPVTFAGWGDGILFYIQPETFEDGYLEIECDKWDITYRKPIINEDWSSGVSVAGRRNNSILLKIDPQKVKTDINFGNGVFRKKTRDLYLVAINECGEFCVHFYFKGKTKKDNEILLYVQDFIMK